MALSFGMPHGLSEDLEAALAAVQTWAGKQDGNGKWVDAVVDGAGLNGYLRNDGAGNSWTIGSATGHTGASLAYTLIGNTMILSAYIPNTALVVATGVSTIYLLIPDSYTAATRYVKTTGHMINGGTGAVAHVQCRPSSRYLEISRTDTSFADDSGGAFSVEFELSFEVARS